ncbi:MAG: ribonuclease HI family protein [Candidatus Krumholzibacteriia bacterium]
MPERDRRAAGKLIRLLEALRGGEDVERALAGSGLERGAAAEILEALARRIASAGTRSPGSQPRAGCLTAQADGASRGNPGPASCAVIITDESGEELLRRSKVLGTATNNVAEYHGVHLALELLGQLGASDVVLKLDSELVVKQLNGEYKVKHPSLKPLFERATTLIGQFSSVEVVHIPRAENKAVDRLANDALDAKS